MTGSQGFPAGLVARYAPVRRLGQGSFGEVWEATQVALGRRVAVKLLIAGLLDNPTTVERFLAEARITASLSHPNIVIVLDHGVDEVPWIVFEFVPGRTLREVLAARGRIGWREAGQAMVELASAIEESHAHGILHRDIKPANILEVEPGRYKVADFGVAKWASETSHLTRTGAIVGTPAYLSPEQLSNQPASERTDVYALALVHYELLTGRLAFPGTTLSEIVNGHLKVPPPRASALEADVPAEVDDIIVRSLAKDPRERTPSAKAYRELLEAQLAPRAAPRATRKERRVTGRSPVAAAAVPPPAGPAARVVPRAAAFAVLALASAIGLAALWLVRARPERPPPVAPPAVVQRGPDAAEAGGIAREAESLHHKYRERGTDYNTLAQQLGQNPALAQPDQAARLAARLVALETADLAAIGRLLARLDASGGGPPFARARLCALDFFDWERRLHAGNAIEAARLYEREGSLFGLTEVGKQMERPIYTMEGVPRLRRYFEAVRSVAEWVAGHPGDPVDLAGVCDDLGEVAHRSGYMKWLDGPRREAGKLVGALRHELGTSSAGRVLRVVWDLRDYARDRKQDAALHAAAAAELVALRPQLPGIAKTIDDIQTRLRAAR